MGRHNCCRCGDECDGTAGCDDTCASYGDGDCWCHACFVLVGISARILV